MDVHVLKLSPVFIERLWGGRRLAELLGGPMGERCVGECWTISAHPSAETTVALGPFLGMGLGEVFRRAPHLFGPSWEGFPMMVKIIDAKMDLSVQVHPDDRLAASLGEPDLGKWECWYVLDCPPDSSIVLGHNCDNPQQVAQMVRQGLWERFLRRVPIAPGDFIVIPPGTVHSLCAGAMVVEVQRSSDLTYRLYDYERLDGDGNRRPLHVEKALRAIYAPQAPLPSGPAEVLCGDGFEERIFLSGRPFHVSRLSLNGKVRRSSGQTFQGILVLGGEGVIGWDGGEMELTRGDQLLALRGSRLSIEGSMELLFAWPSPNL